MTAALWAAPVARAAVVDAVWQSEALGTLLWALQLLELPPYDRPFDPDEVVDANAAAGELRDPEELELERESARLWHWRARTTELQASGTLQLPARYSSFDQLIAATAMRGHDEGLSPSRSAATFARTARSTATCRRSSTPRRTRSQPNATMPSTGSRAKARAGTMSRSTLDIEFSIL